GRGVALESLAPERRWGYGPGTRPGRRVPWPERGGGVDAPGHRPGRLRLRRPVRAAVAVRGSRGSVRPGRAELRVRPVDLRHAPGGALGRRRVVDGQVRMVLAGEPPPGGLDRGLTGAARDTEDVMGIASAQGMKFIDRGIPTYHFAHDQPTPGPGGRAHRRTDR